MEPVTDKQAAENALAIEREFGGRKPEPVTVVVGCDIGQRKDPTAVVVVELDEQATGEWRETGRDGQVTHRRPKTESVFVVRFLERLPLGTPYPAVAERVAEVVGKLVADPMMKVHAVLDQTGVGKPVVDLVREQLRDLRCHVSGATFTGTARCEGSLYSREIKVGKPWLVSRLQALLAARRIKLPETKEARQLAQELLDFEIRVSEKTANLSAGAFRVGTTDDVVCALGLAVAREPAPAIQVGQSIYQ